MTISYNLSEGVFSREILIQLFPQKMRPNHGSSSHKKLEEYTYKELRFALPRVVDF
jgi:hypothetical protein